MLSLLKRNLRVYFRDRATVFFSMLGVIIIIGLYLMFLGVSIAGFGAAAGENARFMMDSWIMGGVIAAASITTAMGAFGTMVDDTQKKIIRDFEASPVRRWQLVLAYVLSSIIIGIIMTVFTFLLAEVYILINGGALVSLWSLIKLLGLVILSVSASSALVFFVTTFLKTANAFSTVSTILGTIVGFLTGAYIPIGLLPDPVQAVIRIFPVSHSAVLFRKIMIAEAVDLDLIGAGVRTDLGIDFAYGTTIMPVWGHILILLATAVVFFGLSVVVIANRKHKK
ncbi:MAG TPA: ABC transporter [Acholeplasmatales bacterium]|nr:MAG: ABC transporter [Tenericutes bacterium GWF2_57_13]HAQ56407.1 ABC transporter [Acholeplasmatales bacterium]